MAAPVQGGANSLRQEEEAEAEGAEEAGHDGAEEREGLVPVTPAAAVAIAFRQGKCQELRKDGDKRSRWTPTTC